MRFSNSIETDIHKPNKYANSDSSSFLSDTSSSDDESSNTTHPYNPGTPLNGTSSHYTIIKTPNTSLSHTRNYHLTDSTSLPSSEDAPQYRTLKPHYKLRQQPRKDYRLFLSPSK